MKQQATNNEKNSERAFTSLFLSSMLAMLLCLCALCSTSYAWFNASKSSGENTLTAACFSFDATVTDEESGIQLVADDGVYTLVAEKRYNVALTKSPSATASQGHCAVLAGERLFCTENFPTDFAFAIEVATTQAVIFDARIGYSAELDLIASNELLLLPSN